MPTQNDPLNTVPIQQFISQVKSADASKAKEKLGWTPQISAQEMCSEMVVEDLKSAKRHALLKAHGYDLPITIEN